ncbi:cyclic pyranopterin monophosphate synthase MoaC [Sulfurisphaera tokodaii]|uniref:Probable cyclic pyranopterin monophosphate synthase n=2 Tax=Sulfurisphaera tokodaii TaxID=111955 RepID=MOAC_SULTO|nr:cyclic pyranopterin monophosphate synthase MoaC [Sulfurisphaera tokodaii]Q975D5.1 RecName: Full=Probable cyclic pyranopterin monophosphate synthase; AltName: Full=Molybdenum cofactor biosynthesis protein C [Sulfurisphaera tokodaii str. 7]2OHD_A Chain A, Probable molybdenum cofactor biosynthesis protein C [Sulfurisphaera tokodaii str. 7]2OHD_B Chain B, Probable molybdenum cofactor biosynthesis protein C [Sulfurisphaera tokodaii str. 7]2OHD_C Chain C, Probable molybdenum cofactor biosynthesis 
MTEAKIVDISSKDIVLREAVVEGYIKLRKETIEKIKNKEVEKGDVITVAKTAGILAAKKTPELIPMCHPIPLEFVDVEIKIEEEGLRVISTVKAHYKTGVEMEALTATSVALLTIWDMVKKYEKDENGQYPYTEIKSIRVINKIKTYDDMK